MDATSLVEKCHVVLNWFESKVESNDVKRRICVFLWFHCAYLAFHFRRCILYIIYILLVAVFACTFLLNKLQASTNSFQFVLRLVQNFLLMIRSLSQLSHLERL